MDESSKGENFKNNMLSMWIHEKEIDVNGESQNKIDRETHVWSVGDEYILKMSRSEEEIKKNIYISQLLLKEGIPVQKVISTLEGNNYIKINNKYYAIFDKIQGNVLSDYYEGNYIARGYYLGKCLGELHKALKKITDNLDGNEDIYDNFIMDEINGEFKNNIDGYIEKSPLAKKDIEIFSDIYQDIRNNFTKSYKKLPRQIIHRDFHGKNLIFNNGKLAGYVDFDLSEKNARLYDLCYFCTGALASVFDNKIRRKRWVLFAKKVILGYKSVIDMTVEEEKNIKNMLYVIQLSMVSYFIEKKYEYIADINIKMINYINEVW